MVYIPPTLEPVELLVKKHKFTGLHSSPCSVRTSRVGSESLHFHKPTDPPEPLVQGLLVIHKCIVLVLVDYPLLQNLGWWQLSWETKEKAGSCQNLEYSSIWGSLGAQSHWEDLEQGLREAKDKMDMETSPSWTLMILASRLWDPEVNYSITSLD